MAAQRKEIAVDTHTVDAEDLGKNRGELRFDTLAWRDELALVDPVRDGSRQAAAAGLFGFVALDAYLLPGNEAVQALFYFTLAALLLYEALGDGESFPTK